MISRVCSALCFSIVFALQLLEVSALHNFTNSTLLHVHGSNNGVAYPTAYSTFANISATLAASTLAPPQTPEPALIDTTKSSGAANPQTKVPDLLPVTSTTPSVAGHQPDPAAPPQKPSTSLPPIQSISPGPAPGPAISSPPAPSPPLKQRPGSIPEQARVTSALQGTEDSKVSIQTSNANQPEKPSFSSGQGQPNPEPSPYSPAGLPLVYTLTASHNTFLVTPGPSSQYVISSQTLTPGSSITVNSILIGLPSHGPSIVIGSSTVAFNPDLPSPNPPLTDAIPALQGSTVPGSGVITVANTPIPYQTSGSSLILDGSKILTPGGTVTVNSVPVFFPTQGSSIVIGSTTVPLNPSPLTVASPITTFPLIIQGQTLTPGGAITVFNTPISLPSAGSALIVGGSSTIPLGNLQSISIGSQALAISQAGASPKLIIDGSTIAPGFQAMVNGATISIPSQATDVVVKGSTIAPGSQAMVNGATISIPSQATDVVIDGSTIAPGFQAMINGATISIPSQATDVVIKGSAIAPGSQAMVNGATISIPSQATDVVIKGSTIAPGSQAIVDGVTISVPPQATDIIIDGSTTVGLGGVILSALAHSPTTTTLAGAKVGGPTGGSNATAAPSSFVEGSSSSSLTPACEVWRRWWVGVFMGFGCVYAGGWT